MNNTKRTCWASVFSEFIGKPYYLGDITGNLGYDCVSLCYNYLIKRGITISYESWKMPDPLNYKDFYFEDERHAMKNFESVLDDTFKICPDKRYKIGDICWISSRRKLTDDFINSPGIYAGNNIIVTTPQTGVVAARFNMIDLKKVYNL